jgi:tellurite resistance protein TerA
MSPDSTKNSFSSLEDANRSRVDFSGHGSSKGAAGYIDPNDQSLNVDFLGRRGDNLSVSPPAAGFGNIRIAAAWDQQTARIKKRGLISKILKKTKDVTIDIDLDLGILYELKNGAKGAIQAFGNTMGSYNTPPFLSLSGDEREGDAAGDDEFIHLNGQKWPEFKRILIYVYIYRGALDWAQFKPQIHIRIPNEKPMVVTLSSHHKDLGLCAIAGIENIRDGMKITNHTEYFPGHAEMDRAFGYGIDWEQGKKVE